MKERKLFRSNVNRWIGGICGGLGKYFGIDSTIWRLIFVCGTLFSAIFPGVLIYLIMWIVVPKEE